MSAHTPGPWTWEDLSQGGSDHTQTLDGPGRCVVFHNAAWLVQEADAKLIAYAPDLLAFARAVEGGPLPTEGANNPAALLRWVLKVRDDAAGLIAKATVR